MLLSKLSRYIAREGLVSWIGVTVVLLVIVMTHRLVRFLSEAASGDLPSDVVFQLLGLKAVTYLPHLLPFTLFVGLLLALGRLYRDNEMAVLFACGVGPGLLMRALSLLVIPAFILISSIALYFGPLAANTSEEIESRAQESAELKTLGSGRFQTSRSGAGVFYAEKVSSNKRELDRVFARAEKNGQVTIVSAPKGHLETHPQTQERYVVLEDGFRYEGIIGQANWTITRYNEHGIRVDSKVVARSPAKMLFTEDLWYSDLTRHQAEFQWRMSMPLLTLTLALMVLPLAKTSPREGKYAKLFWGVLIYVVYFQLLTVLRQLIETSRWPTSVGMWIVHLGFLVLALLLISRQFGPLKRGNNSA